MEPSEIMTILLDLAAAAGLEVRNVGAGGREPGEPSPASGVVRVRDAFWVMLATEDPVAIQLRVLAGALRDHAPELIEGRFLPPAVRRVLEPT